MPPSLASRILNTLKRRDTGNAKIQTANEPTAQSSFGSRIPYDILSYIFAFLPEEHFQESTFRLSSAPWNFTRVCRSWRNSALLIPFLWTSIYINTKELCSRTDDGIVALLETILSRTADRSLDVKIVMVAGYSHPGERWQPLFDILRKESHRWRSLTLLMPAQQDFRSISDYFSLPPLHPIGSSTPGYPALESVELHNAHCSVHSSLFEGLQHSPRLTKVALLPIDSLSAGLEMPPLPWNQISHIDVSGVQGAIPEHQLLSALSQTPKLHTLIARQHQLFSNLQSASPLLQIDTLHTLEVHLTKRDRYQGGRLFMATYLVFPNLKHLRVRGLRPDIDLRDLAAISHILDLVAGELDSLSMSDISIDEIHVVNFLRHHALQRIARLEVDGNLFVQVFESLATDKELVPNLESLDARMVYDDEQEWSQTLVDSSMENIMKLLQSRIGQLERVNLSLLWSKSDNAVAQFKQLDTFSDDLALNHIYRLSRGSIYGNGKKQEEQLHEGLAFYQRRMSYQNPTAYIKASIVEPLFVYNSIFTQAENRLPKRDASPNSQRGRVEDAVHALAHVKESTIAEGDFDRMVGENAGDLTSGCWELRWQRS